MTFDLLVLGGTSWLGGAVARTAVARGHQVTCLARGRSGEVPPAARLVRADRWSPDAYDEVSQLEWDGVLDVTWQPGLARSAVRALAERARHWVLVSSVSVYAEELQAGGDESGPILPPWPGTGEASVEDYGSAKVACEEGCRAGLDSRRLLVARAGLIAGYGDRSDRFGYWPARFALAVERPRDRGAVLVPPADAPLQVVDVADLASWLVASLEHRISGTIDAVGESQSMGDLYDACAAVSGADVRTREATGAWLADHDVTPWAGPDSLPLWLPEEDAAMMQRRGAAAHAAGLLTRPLRDTADGALAWERHQGLERPRRAGLTPERERDLLAALAT